MEDHNIRNATYRKSGSGRTGKRWSETHTVLNCMLINVKLPLGTQIWQCLRNMLLVHIIKLLCIINLLLIGRKAFIQLGYREYKPHVIYKEGSLNLLFLCHFCLLHYFSSHCHVSILVGVLFLDCSTLEPGPYLVGLLENRMCCCDQFYHCNNACTE